ncbi:ROK family protein [Futiania mangrovi]|uniref:ROK family protein n=1 Tax=Futiania mangrovi TaxID=2959716 RepID=A0A9J6P7V2_9PROT|nr:ROK family protein [Futiania mangrovii]MCP1335252.1 ROK family protein [Futiania mangrovii]
MSPSRIGIDLGGTKIEGVLMQADGSIVRRTRVATPRHDYDGTLAAMAGLVAALEEGVDGPPCRVGVGMPGSLSPTTGLVRNANSTWLIGRPFREDLAAALGRPVRIANDADCFALSEARDGAGQGAEIVFGAILGTGVGGGIVIGGSLLQGACGIAGEWGHNPLPAPQADELPGPACYCGRRGCIETWLSGPALECDHGMATGTRLPAAEIAARAAAGDAAASATLDRYADRAARALAGVVNILDPQVIVLGGGVSNVDGLYPRIEDRLGAHMFSDMVAVKLRQARHGASGGVRGAAWLWPAKE